MPSSSATPVPVPIPDRVAVLIGRQLPPHILQAEIAAENAVYNLRLCRSPEYREAREYCLSELAAANKILAAYNPRLIVKAGGRS
ncbi:hypothetical protein ACFWDI_19020 [Streptomyces sp. NPDC060064]|uniref:hypothetical protein n=1 Tax=Streptomyces sp. NPDC060064 TaxID=3347049 RepID=UPI0036A055A6